MNICVFCASALGTSPTFTQTADDLGRAIGERGHTLVFGGFDTGLMGVVARAARSAGASVVGVLPCKAGGLSGRPVFDCDELVEADGLAERKSVMAAVSDAFVVLPGSYGTLDELYTVLSEEKLMGGEHPRPVALLSVDGFYEPLAELDRCMVANGLLAPKDVGLCRAFSEMAPLMDYCEGACVHCV